MTTACFLSRGDGPLDVAQMFAYIRHRYGDLRAAYLEERDVIAVPLSPEVAEAATALRELAARKGLCCCEVCAAWPELLGPGIADADMDALFLVIYSPKHEGSFS